MLLQAGDGAGCAAKKINFEGFVNALCTIAASDANKRHSAEPAVEHVQKLVCMIEASLAFEKYCLTKVKKNHRYSAILSKSPKQSKLSQANIAELQPSWCNVYVQKAL